jgi:hypothetical protein
VPPSLLTAEGVGTIGGVFGGVGAMAYFENPANGYVEKVSGPFTWLLVLVLGPIYLLYKGLWPHALAYVAVIAAKCHH